MSRLGFVRGTLLGTGWPETAATFIAQSKTQKKRTSNGKWRRKREALYAAQSGICHYCKHHIPIANWTIDHKLPRFEGGTNHIKNLAGACKDCNTKKGSLTELAFFEVLNKLTSESRIRLS